MTYKLRPLAVFLVCNVIFLGACSAGPEAQFHYASTAAWIADHPPVAGNAASDFWRAPGSAGRMLTLNLDEDLHLHAGREQWLFILSGRGNLFVGPAGAGFPDSQDMVRYPLAPGDVFLIPRSTAHSFHGKASVYLINSPGLAEGEVDFVKP